MKLSVVIPAHNEEGCIEQTVTQLLEALYRRGMPFEILVINDHSRDATEATLQRLAAACPELRYLNNCYPGGFGFAVRWGLEHFAGDAVAIVMADGSDPPEDLVRFYDKLLEGYDCVFGSRFIPGGGTVDYPPLKLILNRLANTLVRILFAIGYNDATNAFKMYRRETIQGLRPFLSHHFNLTLELPLKSITRGYSYAVLPNVWRNRKSGDSKLKIKEMGSRYLFVVIYCLIEKWLLRGDYRKETVCSIEHPL
jgi:dolichol-phosphate mannosyltransferase